MSELKSRKFFEVVPTSKEGFYQPGAFVDGYLKSEADKVIANQKYKRCMAMARWCESDMEQWVEGCLRWERRKRWRKHWLELAEKFKEAK